MLVATQYESIDSIESKIQNYVQDKLNTQVYELELPDEYSLDDSRLELSSSVKTVDCSSKNAVLGVAEVLLSDCGLSEIKPSITDLLPLELRQEFLYENRVTDSDRTLLLRSRVTDSDRTLLLRKNLTIVTLIQQIQDEVQGVNLSSDTDFDTTLDEGETEEVEQFEESNDFEPTEQSTVVETALINDMPNDIDLNVADLDEFSLDDETEPMSDEQVEDDELDGLDEFEVGSDDEPQEEIDEFSVEDIGEEEPIEDTDTVEPKDLTDISDDTVEDTEPQVIEEINTNNDLNEPTENDNMGKSEQGQEDLSELEIFKSIITKDIDTKPSAIKPNKTYIEENQDLGLEDLESVSEDDIEEETELDNDLLDEDDEFDNELEEDSDNEDIEDFEDGEDTDDEDIEEFEEDSDEDTEETGEELAEDIEDIDFTDEPEESNDHTDFIDKVDDNEDFVDTHNVSMSKPNIDTTKVVPKSELGRILTDKASSDKGIHEKQTFMQEFDKNIEQPVSKAETVKDFKDRMTGAETPQARAPAKTEVHSNEPTGELPPLRTYLKKHPYTLIEDLLKLGYSNAEIQDGVKRGKFLKKNGMLRALY